MSEGPDPDPDNVADAGSPHGVDDLLEVEMSAPAAWHSRPVETPGWRGSSS